MNVFVNKPLFKQQPPAVRDPKLDMLAYGAILASSNMAAITAAGMIISYQDARAIPALIGAVLVSTYMGYRTFKAWRDTK